MYGAVPPVADNTTLPVDTLQLSDVAVAVSTGDAGAGLIVAVAVAVHPFASVTV